MVFWEPERLLGIDRQEPSGVCWFLPLVSPLLRLVTVEPVAAVAVVVVVVNRIVVAASPEGGILFLKAPNHSRKKGAKRKDIKSANRN